MQAHIVPPKSLGAAVSVAIRDSLSDGGTMVACGVGSADLLALTTIEIVHLADISRGPHYNPSYAIPDRDHSPRRCCQGANSPRPRRPMMIHQAEAHRNCERSIGSPNERTDGSLIMCLVLELRCSICYENPIQTPPQSVKRVISQLDRAPNVGTLRHTRPRNSNCGLQASSTRCSDVGARGREGHDKNSPHRTCEIRQMCVVQQKSPGRTGTIVSKREHQ